MAKASVELIAILRSTARRLQQPDVKYQWSHFAHCNCGHLAQTATGMAPREIYEAARVQRGDWAEQALRFEPPDYGDRPALDEGAWEPQDLGRCPVSDTQMSLIIEQLLAIGLTQQDIAALERLQDAQVRRRMGTNKVEISHSDRDNVVAYLLAWADQLEEQLAQAEVSMPLAAE